MSEQAEEFVYAGFLFRYHSPDCACTEHSNRPPHRDKEHYYDETNHLAWRWASIAMITIWQRGEEGEKGFYKAYKPSNFTREQIAQVIINKFSPLQRSTDGPARKTA